MKKLIIVLVLAALFFGCKTDASTTKTYTVTIDPNGGTLEQKTYTVEEGKTFTIPTAPSPAVAYYKVKDYINTTTNSPFTMGTTAVNGDITLKVEWEIDLSVIRDMLTSVTWVESNNNSRLIYRKDSSSSLAMRFDYINDLVGQSDKPALLDTSDRTDMIAKINMSPLKLDYIKAISADSLTFISSALEGAVPDISEKVFYKVP